MFTPRRTAIVASIAALSLAAAPIAGAATLSSGSHPSASSARTDHSGSVDRSRHDGRAERRGDPRTDLSRTDLSRMDHSGMDHSRDVRDS